MLRSPVALLVALLLVGCAPGEAPPGAEAQPTPPPDLSLPSEATDGTPWRDTGLPIEFDAEMRYASPEDLVQAVAQALAAETVVDGPAPRISASVLDVADAAASARVLVGGFADDAVYGGDYFMAFARDEAGWHVAQTWTRDLCRRGVSNGLCL
jgi:hypothetical protein